MKIKTINSILCKKFDDFLKSIEDEEVRKLVRENTIITGGAIASMLLNEKISDFDLYFSNKETAWAVSNYYVEKMGEECPAMVIGGGFTPTMKVEKYLEKLQAHINEARKEGDDAGKWNNRIGILERLKNDPDRVTIFIPSKGFFGDLPDEDIETVEGAEIGEAAPQEERGKYAPVYLSGNAITLSGKVQIVIRFWGDPDTIHENYDFVHCMNYWTSWERKVTTRKKALESLLAKELVYIGSKYPLCSIFRTRKFINRGWTVNAGQYLKMAMQLNEMDLGNVDTLEEQLVGVDAHFFLQVIESLRERNQETVDKAYLTEILNRIFDGGEGAGE